MSHLNSFDGFFWFMWFFVFSICWEKNPMEDELRTTNTFEDAKVDSGFDDVAESNVGANHSASAAVAHVEHLVLRATEA
jgi:hypothetical protein